MRHERDLQNLRDHFNQAGDSLPEDIAKEMEVYCADVKKAAEVQRFEVSSSSLKSSQFMPPPKEPESQGKSAPMPAPEFT